jgi:hypothetical protein
VEDQLLMTPEPVAVEVPEQVLQALHLIFQQPSWPS